MAEATMLHRSVYAIPLVGRIAREVLEGDADNKWYLAVILLTLWVFAAANWGLAAVVVPFLLLAPFCLVMLVAMTRG